MGGSNFAPNDGGQDTRRSQRLAGIHPEYLGLVGVKQEEEDPDIPQTLDDARRSRHAAKWNTACEKELRNMKEREVFELVSPPKGRHIITSKWVFALKRDERGNVIDYKARVVARGFTQKKGVDYDETFAAVATMDSLRLLIALAAEENLCLEHIDVTAAFLNGEIDAEIYMRQPPGYVDEDYPNWVWRLLKSLYGLKQAAKIWNDAVNAVLLDMGFCRLSTDSCVYIRGEKGFYDRLAVLLHVDDFIIAAREEEAKRFKFAMGKIFAIKDIGEAKLFLGIEIEQSLEGIRISQDSYLRRFLEEQKMVNVRRTDTPLSEADVKFMATQDQDKLELLPTAAPYQHIIGKLMYASVGTRPDLAFALSYLARFNARPSKLALQMAKRLLKYVASRGKVSLFYKRSRGEFIFQGYTDASWADDALDRKSTSGYIFLVNGTPVAWKSQRQESVATSSMESEYIAAGKAAKQAVWQRGILKELGYLQEGPTTLFEDNTGAISFAKNPIAHKRTKHIGIQYHFIRELVESRQIFLLYISTLDQLADFLTKPLGRVKFEENLRRLGLLSQ